MSRILVRVRRRVRILSRVSKQKDTRKECPFSVEGYSSKAKISTLALDEQDPHGFVGYAAYGYTDAVSSVMCRVRPTHSCTLRRSSLGENHLPVPKQKDTHKECPLERDYAVRRLRAVGLPSFAGANDRVRHFSVPRASGANPRFGARKPRKLGSKTKGHPQGVSVGA